MAEKTPRELLEEILSKDEEGQHDEAMKAAAQNVAAVLKAWEAKTTTFAEALKAARKAAGLTQQQMAAEGLIPKRSIEDWERGIYIPPEYVQRLLLEWLDKKTK